MYDPHEDRGFVERRFQTPEPTRESSSDGYDWEGKTTPEPEAEKSDPAIDFTFDAGNIRLLVKKDGQVIEGKVSSDALCLASPVWKKFLFPPWDAGEELRHSVKQIDCIGDDSQALLILLNIAHLRFEKVPERVDYRTLLSIATLCDQYHCIKLVRPWLVENLWLLDEESESSKIGQHKWLVIAWVFGRRLPFFNLSKNMVTDIRVDSDEEWIGVPPMPPGIIDAYEQSAKIKTDYYSSREGSVCKKQYSERDRCNSIVYGSLVLSPQSINLFPRKNAEDIAISVNELAIQLKKLQIQHLPCGDEVRSDHKKCGIQGLASAVDRALGWLSDPMLDSHTAHMRTQLECLGR